MVDIFHEERVVTFDDLKARARLFGVPLSILFGAAETPAVAVWVTSPPVY